ncbi:nucleotidyltransferase family protein [Thalassomonas actiniarum]|uniref:Nucleotidyltransferase family protein n=1 Tax=Thalassomonas actiniarum TaxID=485447 RepID=A0AAF0C501_9GAMM|nr:nucleotidyltransferase family protein [Thalassomonas actiniarum]WDE00360.1 nucleotidyltransferase family protein [Thalassomonas actiniarum]
MDQAVHQTTGKTGKLAVIVLAAGGSTRLGQPKQLVELVGEPLIVRQCRHALTLTEQVFCVLGCQAPLMAKQLTGLPVCQVNNENWQQGMSSSIAAGVAALPDDIDAAMILLVDQWQLASAELQLLQQSWQKHPEAIVLAGASAGTDAKGSEAEVKKGPPVIFPKCYFPELLALTGEQGAKPVLQKYHHRLNVLDLPRAFIDLDTPQQLQQLLASRENNPG